MEGANNNRKGSYAWRVRVRSAAHLDPWIKDYFSGLSISHETDGSSVLTGLLQDMPALYGLIIRLRDSGIVMLSLQVERIKSRSPGDPKD